MCDLGIATAAPLPVPLLKGEGTWIQRSLPLQGEGQGEGAAVVSSQTQFARKLRATLTDAERALWYHLRAKRFCNFKFRRQFPIGPYIVDFVCMDKRLVIECDGGQHFASRADRERDRWLIKKGYRVLRFWNPDVLQNIEGVLEVIVAACT